MEKHPCFGNTFPVGIHPSLWFPSHLFNVFCGVKSTQYFLQKLADMILITRTVKVSTVSRKHLARAFCCSQFCSWICSLLSAFQIFGVSRELDLSDLSELSLFHTSLIPWAL